MASELRADPLMPATAIAWRPAAMLTVFRDTFTTKSNSRWTIDHCRVSRFRYRPQMRSIVLYELTLQDSLKGMSRRHWVTGSLYPGKRARRRYDQLLAEGVDKVGDLCGWPFDPVVYLDKLGMLLQVYPVDRYLPTLPGFLRQETSTLDEVVMSLASKGLSRIVQCRMEPSRYRPGFGATLRYSLDIEVDTSHSETHTVYVKVYRETSEAQTAFNFYQDISAQSRACASGFRMIDSIACLPEHRALILPQAPGLPLEDLLNGAHDAVTVAVRRTATATAALHASSLKIERIASDERMRAGAQRNAEFIAWAYPTFGSRVRALASHNGSREYAPAHMDLKADHVFLDKEGVTFIDLDSVAMADPVFDIAMLAVRLRAMQDVCDLSYEMAQLGVHELLDTYFGLVPGEWCRRWQVNVARATLKVALFYVKHLLNDWPAKIEAMIALAEATSPYGEKDCPWS